MVFILQQDRDRRPRLHHIQRLRRYENWLSCRRLSRRRLSFRQRRGSFPFRRLLYHRPLFLQLSYHQLVRLLFTYGRLIHCIKLILRSSSLAGTAWTPAVDAPWSTIP